MERDIQTEIMNALMQDPRVVWAMVTTTGKVRHKGYWMSLGFPGLSDIVGQLITGQALCIEVKRPGEAPTQEQIDHITLVNRNNGVAGWCSSVAGAMEIIDESG